GLKDIKLDLRVIAATNKNLREAVKEGAFRQDLYFRLNVIQILIPPLRERVDDIAPMTKFFIDHYNRKFKRQIEGVTDAAARLLAAHDWPGNVRELRNAIERAMILEESAYITPASLPIAISRPNGGAPAPAVVQIPADGLSLEENERHLLAQALEKTDGNQTQAARLLRITRDTLRYTMKKVNLRSPPKSRRPPHSPANPFKLPSETPDGATFRNRDASSPLVNNPASASSNARVTPTPCCGDSCANSSR